MQDVKVFIYLDMKNTIFPISVDPKITKCTVFGIYGCEQGFLDFRSEFEILQPFYIGLLIQSLDPFLMTKLLLFIWMICLLSLDRERKYFKNYEDVLNFL